MQTAAFTEATPLTPQVAVAAERSRSTLMWTDGTRRIVEHAPAVLTDRSPLLAAARLIATFLEQHALPAVAAGVGVSGLNVLEADVLLDLLGSAGVAQAAVSDNTTARYLGALGDDPGVLVVAGTGAVTLARGADEVARVDGWGWVMGDAGSAYWIGRNALEAAMRGYDGRRQMTALTDVVLADFGDIEAAHPELLADANRVARVAGYAAVVDRLAQSDPVAANILDKAAAHLAEAVVAGAHRVGLGQHEPPHVCALGSVFESARLTHKFVDYLTIQWPSFALTRPAGSTIEGALLLPGLSPTSPLADRVARASRPAR